MNIIKHFNCHVKAIFNRFISWWLTWLFTSILSTIAAPYLMITVVNMMIACSWILYTLYFRLCDQYTIEPKYTTVFSRTNNYIIATSNEHQDILIHLLFACLISSLFKHTPKKTSKLCITGLSKGNSQVSGWFPLQRASNAENDFISWCHHLSIDV